MDKKICGSNFHLSKICQVKKITESKKKNVFAFDFLISYDGNVAKLIPKNGQKIYNEYDTKIIASVFNKQRDDFKIEWVPLYF